MKIDIRLIAQKCRLIVAISRGKCNGLINIINLYISLRSFHSLRLYTKELRSALLKSLTCSLGEYKNFIKNILVLWRVITSFVNHLSFVLCVFISHLGEKISFLVLSLVTSRLILALLNVSVVLSVSNGRSERI